MDIDEELMAHLLIEEEADINVEKEENMAILFLLASTTNRRGHQCHTQRRRFKAWKEEDQAKAEDGGQLHATQRLFC